MSNGKKLSMTARPVKYCFKYLFAIFHNHLSPEQAFPSFKLFIHQTMCGEGKKY